MNKRINLTVGTILNINDECIGKVTLETRDRIYIMSKCFTGWATKSEIQWAIRQLAKPRQSRRRRFAIWKNF